MTLIMLTIPFFFFYVSLFIYESELETRLKKDKFGKACTRNVANTLLCIIELPMRSIAIDLIMIVEKKGNEGSVCVVLGDFVYEFNKIIQQFQPFFRYEYQSSIVFAV